MANIAIYTFNSSTNTLPTFNDDFTYEYTDVGNGDGTTTRTITSDSLPSKITFKNLSELVSVDFVDISGLTSLDYLFCNTEKLERVNISNWDTSNITNMDSLFDRCYKLTTLEGINNWDVSKVTNMNYMFFGCGVLETLDLSNWDVSNVTSMLSMFDLCYALTSVGDLSNWNTSKVTNMFRMFAYCYELKLLNLSKWDTSNVTNMRYMFTSCSELTSLIINSYIISDNNDIEGLISSCGKLKLISMANSDNNSINKVISQLPARTSEAPGILLIEDEKVNSVNKTDAESNYWNVPIGLVSLYMFNKYIDTLPTFNEGFTYEYIDVDNGDDTISRTITSGSLPSSIHFRGCTGLNSLSYLDTSNMNDISYMFIDCTKLVSLDLSSFDTSNVIDMSYMFYNCTKLVSLDLSSFDISNVIGMNNMMFNCNKLVSVNMRIRDVHGVNKILTKLPIKSEGTPGVLMIETTDEIAIDIESANNKNWSVVNYLITEYTFNNTIDTLPTFGSSFVYEYTDVDNGDGTITRTIISDEICNNINFSGCSELININYLNTSNLSGMDDIFNDCVNLKLIKMINSDVNTINELLSNLTTRSNIGKIYLIGMDDISGIDKTTAESKKWKIVFQENRTNTLVPIRLANKCVRAVYTNGEKIL